VFIQKLTKSLNLIFSSSTQPKNLKTADTWRESTEKKYPALQSQNTEISKQIFPE
jgi:hypothetical protein